MSPDPRPSEPALAAARDALEAIASYRRGEIDGLALSRALVDDEPLRELVPIPLLLTFLGVDAQFGTTPDDSPEGRAEREEILADESASLERDCTTLAAHLENALTRLRNEPG